MLFFLFLFISVFSVILFGLISLAASSDEVVWRTLHLDSLLELHVFGALCYLPLLLPVFLPIVHTANYGFYLPRDYWVKFRIVLMFVINTLFLLLFDVFLLYKVYDYTADGNSFIPFTGSASSSFQRCGYRVGSGQTPLFTEAIYTAQLRPTRPLLGLNLTTPFKQYETLRDPT